MTVSLTCVPKGPPPTLAWFCTASAKDAKGQPVVGETVCFTSDADAMFPAPDGQPPVPDPAGSERLCLETDAAGQATIEVVARTLPIVVKAHYVGLGARERLTIEAP